VLKRLLLFISIKIKYYIYNRLMPPGRKKMIGPLLPKGGYRSLITKKKKAETAAFYAGIPKKVFYGGNKEKAMTAPYKSITRRRGRPSKASLMPIVPYYLKSSNTEAAMATKVARVKRTATAAQLAALAKARAARAAKKTGAVVAVAVAAPKAQGAKRGRPRKTAATGPQYAYGEYF
jgi:hypothetical protein